MANSFKNTWWILLLIIAGGVIFLLAFFPNKNSSSDRGVVLNDILTAPKTDPVPPMAIVTSPVNGHEAGFTIQVYSFQDKKRAENALQALKSNGYQAFLIMSDLGEKGIWWRVRVEGIADEAAAHQMLEAIRKTYNSGFIVKPQN